MTKKKIVCLNKVDNEWIIEMEYNFLQIIITFPKLNPKLVCTINYATWRRLLSKIRLQEMEREIKKESGEILWGIGDDGVHYAPIAPVVPATVIVSAGEIKKAEHFDFTDEDKETGLRETISVRIEDITLCFDRNLFLKFRDSLITADEVLLKELELQT